MGGVAGGGAPGKMHSGWWAREATPGVALHPLGWPSPQGEARVGEGVESLEPFGTHAGGVSRCSRVENGMEVPAATGRLGPGCLSKGSEISISEIPAPHVTARRGDSLSLCPRVRGQ